MATESKNVVRRIAIDAVKPRMNTILFVDARSATALGRNPLQVPGAVHVPVKTLEENAGRLPRGRTIVTYCT